MMKHYITEVHIEKLRNLSNIVIQLNPEEKQHLIITGKNGSGKTTLLLAIEEYLAINSNLALSKYSKGIELKFNRGEDLDRLYKNGDFITAFFPANRQTTIELANGVSNIQLQKFYDVKSKPGNLLLKYMVHLKTQQSYARNEGDTCVVNQIQEWFNRFEEALRVLLDDESVFLEYDYKKYDFKIHEKGREAFRFNELSDGYSSLINIVSDLMLRMDKNWLLKDHLSSYDVEGIVLIDELETHLHIELQKKILPFLTKFFPELQFIITTHSPYILTSVSNAKCYDLENRVELENLSFYSSDELAESYFNADEYSEELKFRIKRYQQLMEKKNPTEDERAERAQIRMQLKNIPTGIARDVKQMVEEIEGSRKNNDKI
ncbi:MAG: AAA family ATPase [Eubacteriales bacterium]|nr:AAA family ATPase [Eubacteriales bacterium]